VDRISGAVNYYEMPVNVIIEPHGLAEVVTKTNKRCEGRRKKEVLAERIELIRYVAWSFAEQNKQKQRIIPNQRLFLDAGDPGQISEPREKLAIANALEKILNTAEFDGVSVNVAGHYSFAESLKWAKEIIGLVLLDARKKLTVAIDIGRSGNRVEGKCNARGAALDPQLPTLDHPDPRVELTMIIKDPSESDGEGAGCNGGKPAGSFDLEVFKDYLRNTAKKHPSFGN
jgi:hypothetical protein